MGYSSAISALRNYRVSHIGLLLGENAASWFTATWGSLSSMLDAFSSDAENKDISGSYSSGTSNERIPAHVKLDYVCGLRREVRKQYVSGEDGIYTDVTPFRHGITSAQGASVLDDALNQVITRKAST